MLKTLLKKDLQAMLVTITTDRRKGTRRSTGGIIGFGVLFALVFVSLGFAFFTYAALLGSSIGAGNWVYMSLTGCMGLLLGLFGSIFSTFTTLYKAKDNELLLSLPIPPGNLLLSKIFTVYAMSLLFCTLAMLPGFIYSWIEHAVSPLGVVLSILTIFFMALLVTALSCVLGWLVALVVGLFPKKNIVTVLVTLLFIAVYYLFYFKIQQILQSIITNIDAIENGIRGYAYPIYAMGRGALGHVPSFLAFAGIALAVFAVVYLVLSRSFIRISTRTEKQHMVQYREKRARQSGEGAALLRKEFKRFTGSAVYMLNCGLGTLLMPIAAIVILVNMKDIRNLLEMAKANGLEGLLAYVPLIAAAMVCFISTMNDLSAPSISLEAKNLWLLKSLPVSTDSIFRAKKNLNNVCTIIPALILLAVAAFVLKMNIVDAAAAAVLVVLFIMFCSAAGLAVNLKMPNLNWTNETVAVKQSGSVLVVLFGGWVVVLIIGALYWLLLRKVVSPQAFLYIMIGFFLVANILVESWLRHGGRKAFEAL
ncbi:MAG: hypothetical protein IJM39_07200 [Firmicutes bacterium]|nr:hypothetical protein [Bacillota bacterium]